jgi:hypothetical protein
MRKFWLLIAFIPWFFSMVFLGIASSILKYVYRKDPDTPTGNCWTYCLPRFQTHGGYLLIKPAPDVKFLKRFTVYHCLWVKELNTRNKLEQTVPLERKKSYWFPWHTIFFKYKIIPLEKPLKPVE